MKKIFAVIAALILVMAFAACDYQDVKEKAGDLTDTAVYEDTQAVIGDADFYELDDGRSVVRVHVTFTNNGSRPAYMYESFAVHAFQGKTELDNITDVSESKKTGDSANLIKEVKDGGSIEGSYVFELVDGSKVNVGVCSPTDEEDLLAGKRFRKR